MRTILVLLILSFSTLAFGQGTLLQGSATTAGHVPEYVTQGTGQAVVIDAGGAGGGGPGVGLSELGITARGTGTPPFIGQGTGPFGTNDCDYDAPTTNATGYHFLCFSANVSGAGLIAYGASGGQPQQPLALNLNGTVYQFPFAISGIVGPPTSIVNDVACWNNLVGTLLKDCGPFIAGPVSSTVNDVACWNNTTGTALKDCGVAVTGPVSSTVNDVACWNNTSGTLLKDCGGGADLNILNSQTANYSVAATDCGKTIQLGTGATGFFTLTFPSVSGFSTTCSVKVIDGDTGRGKAIAGLTGITKLYPGQTFTAKIVNGAWALFDKPPRWLVPSSLNVYVDFGAGTDTNDCLAAGTGACATPNQAMTDIARLYDNEGAITIQWGCIAGTPCTWGDTVMFGAQSYVGKGTIILQGDIITPDNFLINCTACSNTGVFTFSNSPGGQAGGIWTVQGFKLASGKTGEFGLFVGSGATVNLSFQAIDFGNFTGSGSHIGCSIQGVINSIGNYTISGGATSFADIEDGCVTHFTTGVGTLTGTPAFTQFLNAHGAGAIIGTNSANFSGSATGKRFACTLLALIDTAATSGSLPGNAGGTPTAGTLGADGCYVD
jgi:hypothetical protein